MSEQEVYDFGMRLKALRNAKKLSQQKLADRLGVSKGTIYRYESNTQEPTLEKAAKLAVELGTTLDHLAGLEEIPAIRIPDLSDEQRTVLNDFIRVFVAKK